MATGQAQRAYHSALVASTVDTVTINHGFEFVEIINRNGTAEIFFTLDGTTNPTVAGADCYIIPGAITSRIRANPLGSRNTTVVKLISSGTPNYTVQGADNTMVPSG
jgi:hypothetical protein